MTLEEIKNVLTENIDYIFKYNVVETEVGCELVMEVFDREYRLPVSHIEMRQPKDSLKEKWMQLTSAFYSELYAGVELVEYHKQTLSKAASEAQQNPQQQQSTPPEPCESENLVGNHEALASL
jgi:hypothetical protein